MATQDRSISDVGTATESVSHGGAFSRVVRCALPQIDTTWFTSDITAMRSFDVLVDPNTALDGSAWFDPLLQGQPFQLADIAAATDSVVRWFQMDRAASDAAVIAEAVTRDVVSSRAVFDTAAVIETITHSLTAIRGASDTAVGVTDVWTWTQQFNRVFRPEDSAYTRASGEGPSSVQYVPIGLAPQADPSKVFRPDAPAAAASPGGSAFAPFISTGIAPQPDPPRLFRDKASKTS